MRVLPHAVRCHQRTDYFSQSDDDRVSRLIPFSGRQAHRAEVHVFQLFPPLQYNATQGSFFGGNFWDSRATGYLLRSPDAEQSQFPPVDPAEMGNPDTACIVWKLSLAPYRPLFELIWGAGSFNIAWPGNIAQICATPTGASVFASNTQPVHLIPRDR